MEILLNGRQETVEDRITVSKLIEKILPAGRRVAVEVNREIVPRARHAEHTLRAGDQVEIVHAIGGG
jgi:sulfur carrier protein